MMTAEIFFKQKLELSHEQVTVRTLEPEDGAGLKAWANDADIWRYNPRYPDGSQFEVYFADLLRQKYSYQLYPFVMVDTSSAQIMGTTRFGAISFEDSRLEIGWTWLALPWRGGGINRIVKFLLLRHVFEVMNFERVEFKCDARNIASRTALRRIGAVEEGIFRSHMHLTHMPRRDTVWFSILRGEWPQLRETVFSDFAGK